MPTRGIMFTNTRYIARVPDEKKRQLVSCLIS